MMARDKPRDPVAHPPAPLKTKVKDDQSVVLAITGIVVPVLLSLLLLFVMLQGPDWTAPPALRQAFRPLLELVVMLIVVSVLSMVAYAVVYPIYCCVRWLTPHRAWKPHLTAPALWFLSLGGALLMLIVIPLYANIGGRPRVAKAQADIRSVASAVSIYWAHFSGLPPADSSRTDCPVAAEPGGPHPLPQSLLVQQTNAQGQAGGPFLNRLPRPPAGWTGAGNSYAYWILPGGNFVICAT